MWGAGANGEVSLAIPGLSTFGLIARGRGIGVKLHQQLTLMQS